MSTSGVVIDPRRQPKVKPAAAAPEELPVPDGYERTRDLHTGRTVLTPKPAPPPVRPANPMRTAPKGAKPPRTPRPCEVVAFGVWNPALPGQVEEFGAFVVGPMPSGNLRLQVLTDNGFSLSMDVPYSPELAVNCWTFQAKPKE